jgi:hypothetical protein
MKKLFYIIEPIDVDGDKIPDGFLASQYRIDKYGNKIFLKNKYITFAAFNARLNKKGGVKNPAAPKRKLIKNKSNLVVMTKDEYNNYMNHNAYNQQYPHSNNNQYPQLPQYPPGVLINTGNNIPFNGFNNGFNPNNPTGFNPNYPNGYNPNYPNGYNPNYPNGYNPNYPNGYNPNNPNGNNPTFMEKVGDSMISGVGLGFGFAAGDALFDGVASFF